jgi:acyl carrier protein
MTQAELKAILLAEIGNIAPEADLAATDPDGDLRETFDLDSMDFLNLVTALHKRLGVDIPEADYAKLSSVNAAIAYLAEHQAKA